MSKNTLHWEKHHSCMSADEQRRAEQEDLKRVSKSVNSYRNQDDINWLEGLLVRWPELNDVHRRKIRESIEWLQGCSTRSLGESYASSWRSYYTKIEIMLRRGIYSSFQEREKTEEESHRGLRRRVCRNFRSREAKSRPDWMTDPSKLPKAPPGREGAK